MTAQTSPLALYYQQGWQNYQQAIVKAMLSRLQALGNSAVSLISEAVQVMIVARCADGSVGPPSRRFSVGGPLE